MTLGRCPAIALLGLQGHLVEVEADVAPGLPAFGLVGLPDTALAEARDRVRAATANAGVPLPPRRITVNLSPAALPKTGTGFDLAVASALLAAAGVVPARSVESRVHLGELALDGRVRPVPGVLPAVLAAVRCGREEVVVPWDNAAEARLVPGARVLAVRHLAEAIALHRGGRIGGPQPAPDPGPEADRPPRVEGDLADVLGQDRARRALEVAAAGGHHLYLLGPPGAGKTMLAARLPGILPDLDDDAALEVSAVHSVAGALDGGLVRRPPFEAPHHTASVAALVGGGSRYPRPGAASRAHRGVLLLDEAPEFRPRALDALRQPLEEGHLSIHRAAGVARFPARFHLVLTANPCPCGRATGRGDGCGCPSTVRRRYLARISGPLLDRIDLQIEVLPTTRADLSPATAPESSRTVGERVSQALDRQRRRLGGTPWRCNGEVPGRELHGRFAPCDGATRDLDRALDEGTLTTRGYDRALRVAWTLADLEGRDRPGRDDVARALMLRAPCGVTP